MCVMKSFSSKYELMWSDLRQEYEMAQRFGQGEPDLRPILSPQSAKKMIDAVKNNRPLTEEDIRCFEKEEKEICSQTSAELCCRCDH